MSPDHHHRSRHPHRGPLQDHDPARRRRRGDGRPVPRHPVPRLREAVRGPPLPEMPALMARTCGICPVSHLLAAAKACDDLMAVTIPDVAVKLRRIMNFAQIIQSHALSFFHLSSPDLLLGWMPIPRSATSSAWRPAIPQMAKDGIWLRKFGQQVIEWMGGEARPPGLDRARRRGRAAGRRQARPHPGPDPAGLRDHRAHAELVQEDLRAVRGGDRPLRQLPHAVHGPGLGRRHLEHYDGTLRVVDSRRKVIDEGIKAPEYLDYIGESVEPFSYLKSPYYKPMGYPEGIYRVGPLARLNVADRCGMPLAAVELFAFRKLQQGRRPQLLPLPLRAPDRDPLRHRAHRAAAQRARHPQHAGARPRRPQPREGVGISEAPRGTLIHHYKRRRKRADHLGQPDHRHRQQQPGHEPGRPAGGQAVREGHQDQEGALNRVEAVIRCYDPCLSCSTHALGQMPLRLELRGPSGELLHQLAR
jgi:NAD-reducing hydrogenase large subunit